MDEPARDLIKADFVPNLCFVAWFLPADDSGAWLKQADQFLLRWDRLARQHAPRGLVDHLFAVGQYGAQLLKQGMQVDRYLALEMCHDAMRLRLRCRTQRRI